MALVKYLVKDLAWDSEKKKLSDTGISIASANQPFTPEDVQNINRKHNINIKFEDVEPEYLITAPEKIDEFLEKSLEDYDRVGDLGQEMRFKAACESLQNIRKLAVTHNDYDFSRIPTEAQQQIIESFQRTLEHMQSIMDFKTSANEAARRHKDISGNIENEYNTFFNLWGNIAAAKIKSGEEGPPNFSAQKKEIEATIKDIHDFKAQAEQAAQGVISESKKAGIAQEAVHFRNEAQRHHDNASKFLGRVGWMSVAVIAVAAGFHFLDAPPIDSAGGFNWNHYVPRFSILALLIFFDAILIGIYKAERHNAIINKHRANALNTFETMTAATLTQDVKDAVTLTAAGAIYAPQETGYSKRGTAQQINVAEMLANIAANK